VRGTLTLIRKVGPDCFDAILKPEAAFLTIDRGHFIVILLNQFDT